MLDFHAVAEARISDTPRPSPHREPNPLRVGLPRARGRNAVDRFPAPTGRLAGTGDRRQRQSRGLRRHGVMSHRMPRLVDTSIRVLSQEPLAGRMPTADILRLAGILDQAGFAYLEISGGGVFDNAVRRGVESPWERIRALKARTSTPLALALRGRFLVGSRPVGGDFARRFVASAAQSGIDVFRLHDPLNDVDNLREAAEAIVGVGQGVRSGAALRQRPPRGAARSREETARAGRGAAAAERPRRGAAAASRRRARPRAARALRAAGRALRAGRGRQRARRCDRSLACRRRRDRRRRLSGCADDAPRLGRVGRAGARRRRARHRASTCSSCGTRRTSSTSTSATSPSRRCRRASPSAPHSTSCRSGSSPRSTFSSGRRPPGDRLDEVIDEVGRVREEVGSPPLAAPIGQIVASQALLNVLTANRYSTMVDELRDLVSGRFGRTPARSTPALAARRRELRRRATTPPVDLDALRDEAGGLASSEEELLLLALFGEEAEPLLRAIRERSGGDESLAAGGVDQARQERIREVVRIVQETGVGEITIEEEGMRVSVRRTAEPTYLPAAPHSSGPRARSRQPVATARRCTPARREPDGRHLLPVARAGAAAFVEVGDPVAAGETLVHPRGDEADERGQVRGRGASSGRSMSATPSPSSSASSSSSSSRSTADPSTPSDGSLLDVPAGPRCEPWRDRRAGDPRAARARRRSGRDLLDGRP